MKRRTVRPARRILARTALASAAGLAVLTSGTGAALADEASAPDDLDPSSQTPEGDGSQGTPSETPAAPADETPAAPPAETDATGEGNGSEVEVTAEAPATDVPADEAEAPAPVVAPNYGTQKLRVGVQQADGSWIDRDASFAGTTMTVTITGGVDEEGAPLPDVTTSCVVTDEATIEELVLDTEPPFPGEVDCEFSGGSEINDTLYTLAPGQSATIVPDAASAPAGIVLDPTPVVVEPCVVVENPDIFQCGGFLAFVSVVVEATGPAPVVGDDVVDVAPGETVELDVLANDTDLPCAPVTSVSIEDAPARGTASVVGELTVLERPADCDVTPPAPELAPAAAAITAPSTLRVRYTAPTGFAGADAFTYSLASVNGTTTGTVTVNVVAPVVTPPVVNPPVTGPVSVGDLGSGTGTRGSNGRLPSTGGPAGELLALGAVLVAAGLGATAVRRREPRGLVG